MRNALSSVVASLGVLCAATGCGGGGGGLAGANAVGTVTLLTPAAAPGSTGVAYTQQFEADFPHPPGVFLVTGGALPLGLYLDGQTGVLSGYPRQAGSFHFKIAARDGVDPSLPNGRDANFAQDAEEFRLDVALGPPHIIPQTVPGAVYRASYGYQIDVAGGTPPYTFAQTGGSLPDGLTVDPSGFIGSFPSPAVAQDTPYLFQVTVTDANGFQDTQTLAVQVIVPPLIISTSNPIPESALGFPYQLVLALASNGGGAPFTWSQKFPLAPGETDLALIGMEVTGAGALQNKAPATGPTALGTFTFTIQVIDQPLQLATRQLALKVNPGPVLTLITPNRASGPAPWTVTGTNFQLGAQLLFKPGPNQVTVLPTFVNSNTLTFAVAPPTPVGGFGAVDVMVKNPDGGNHTKTGAFVFTANTLAFGTKGFIASTLSSTGLDAADVNGDNFADVVHCGAAGFITEPYGTGFTSTIGGLNYHPNLGGNPPTFGTQSLDSGNWFDVKFADVNVDGKKDIVALGYQAGNVTTLRVWLNGISGNPLGVFTAGTIQTYSLGIQWPAEMSIANIDGDLLPDIAFGSAHYTSSGGRVYTLKGDGVGGFTLLGSATTTLTGTMGVIPVTTLDINNDGRFDIVAGQAFHNSGSIINYELTGAGGAFGTWTGAGAGLSYACTLGLATGDVLGTGANCVISVHSQDPSDGNNRKITRYSGFGNISTVFDYGAPAALGKSICMVDGDFDNKLEFAVSTHPGAIVVYRGSTGLLTVTMDASVGVPGISTPRTGRMASADINNDGRPDVLSTTSYWAVDYQPYIYSGSYSLAMMSNGGNMGVVFFLNTSN